MLEYLPLNLLLHPAETHLTRLLHDLAGLVIVHHMRLHTIAETAAPSGGGAALLRAQPPVGLEYP